jgi:hypothetical protein
MHLKNWFVVPKGVHNGTFEITDHNIDLPFLQDGQYYRICGSVFNDGLHKYGSDMLTDETFSGSVWALAIPKAVIDLAVKIEDWQEKHGEVRPYSSESFGGYSYSMATDASTGGQVTWETAFRKQLNPYRQIRENSHVKPFGGRYEPFA